jgi:hypothetical protein
VERVQVGGGRASTRWRILIHKLRPDHASGDSSSGDVTHQPGPRDTAQEHTPVLFHRMHQGLVSKRSTTTPPLPQAAPATTTCEHGDDPGRMQSGFPRCPLCRNHILRQQAPE